MSDMKKLFKHDCKYYFFAFIAIASLTTFFYQIYIKDFVDSIIGEFSFISTKAPIGWTIKQINESLIVSVNSFKYEMTMGIYWFTFWMVIVVCLIYLGKSILKTGKGTREFVATLPVKRNNRIIFEIINTCVIVIGSYAVFLINMATVWAKIINFKAIENLNLNLFEQMEGSIKLMLIACISTISFVTFLAVIDTVVSNGIIAILIGFVDCIYFLWFTILIYSLKLSYQGESMYSIIAINNQGENMYAISANIWNVFLVGLIIGLISFLLILLAVNLTKRIDYAKGGLFYLNVFRYIHLGLLVSAYSIWLIGAIMEELKWYSIAIIFCVNYLITPRKIKN